jgi:hypothetical protein
MVALLGEIVTVMPELSVTVAVAVTEVFAADIAVMVTVQGTVGVGTQGRTAGAV